MRMNPKQLEKMARKMGMQMEQIDAEEVIIRTPDKELVIRNPSVSKVNMMGQETFQISGQIEERGKKPFTEEDIETVMDQTGADRAEVERVLMETRGDLAETILKLKKKD